LGEKWLVNLACNSDFHVNRRDLLYAANLRHGTDTTTATATAAAAAAAASSSSFGLLKTPDTNVLVTNK
jgi:hypothetical protein